MMIPPFGPIRVAPSFFWVSERFGGWPNLFSELRGLYLMWRREHDLDVLMRKPFRWAIRLVSTLSGQMKVLEPKKKEIKNLLFHSRQAAEAFLLTIPPQVDRTSWLEWKVVDMETL